MNKFRKLFMVGMLFVLVFSVASCAEREADFIPPETEQRELTVGDIYDWNETGDGSTRPDLGSGYYTPEAPQTDAVITIHESSAVTFADGSKSLTLPLNSKLKQENFAASTLGGHTIGGFAVYGAGDEILSFADIASFAPADDATIAPYWTAENGEKGVGYGSGGFDKHEDEEGIRWYSAPETSNILLDGYPAARIESDNTLKAGSRFRAKVAYDIQDGQSFDLYYRYHNFGDEAVSFTVYQMIDGSDWQDESKQYDSSESITLQPGATSDLIHLVIDEAAADDYLLTLVKFDKDVNGFSLGARMEMTMHPVKPKPVSVTLDLPSGVSVADWSGEQMTGEKLVLPADDKITNGTGKAILGWYDAATGTKVSGETMLVGDMTVAPYFNVGKDGITQLTFGTAGEGAGVAVVEDVSGSDVSTIKLVGTEIYDGYIKGTTLTGSGSYANGYTFRVKTNYQWDNHTVTKADIHYSITNNGTEKVSFTLYVLPSGSDITAAGAGKVQVVDLAPGETRAVVVEDFNQTNATAKNLLSFIQFNGACNSFDLHIGIAVEDLT